MKGCQHDQTMMEDECDCIVPHTNSADGGLPHDSLIDYTNELEARLNRIYVLADDARGFLGQARDIFYKEPRRSNCSLCSAKEGLDAIRREANPLLR